MGWQARCDIMLHLQLCLPPSVSYTIYNACALCKPSSPTPSTGRVFCLCDPSSMTDRDLPLLQCEKVYDMPYCGT